MVNNDSDYLPYANEKFSTTGIMSVPYLGTNTNKNYQGDQKLKEGVKVLKLENF